MLRFIVYVCVCEAAKVEKKVAKKAAKVEKKVAKKIAKLKTKKAIATRTSTKKKDAKKIVKLKKKAAKWICRFGKIWFMFGRATHLFYRKP